MTWSKTVRTTLLALVGVELAASVFLFEANRYRKQRDELVALGSSTRSEHVPGELRGLAHLYSELPRSLYLERPEWSEVLLRDARRSLLRQIAHLYGLDVEALASAASMPPPDTAIFNAEWREFKESWAEELVTLAANLIAYLDSARAENMLHAQTPHAGRFQQLPFILSRLQVVSDSLAARLAGPSTEYHGFYEDRKYEVDETRSLLDYLHKLLLAVDGLAYANEQLERQGVLAYGPDHSLTPQIVRVEPITILGIPVPASNAGRWVATIVAALMATIYGFVLWKGRRETFDVANEAAEAWFLLALPVPARHVTALVLPGIGLVGVWILAWA